MSTEERWKTDWPTFVRDVGRLCAAGGGSDELSGRFGDQEVEWVGKVVSLQRGDARGARITMAMNATPLGKGTAAKMSRLDLYSDDDGFGVGDVIRFWAVLTEITRTGRRAPSVTCEQGEPLEFLEQGNAAELIVPEFPRATRWFNDAIELIRAGDTKRLSRKLDEGGDVNEETRHRFRLLEHAVVARKAKAVALLIEHGTPLDEATLKGYRFYDYRNAAWLMKTLAKLGHGDGEQELKPSKKKTAKAKNLQRICDVWGIEKLPAEYARILMNYPPELREVRWAGDDRVSDFQLMASIDQIVTENETVKSWREECAENWPKSMIVIGHDGCGQLFGILARGDNPMVKQWDHESTEFSDEVRISEYPRYLRWYMRSLGWDA